MNNFKRHISILLLCISMILIVIPGNGYPSGISKKTNFHAREHSLELILFDYFNHLMGNPCSEEDSGLATEEGCNQGLDEITFAMMNESLLQNRQASTRMTFQVRPDLYFSEFREVLSPPPNR